MNQTDPSPHLLKRHDDRLDLFITKLAASLKEPTVTPNSLADRALQLAADAHNSSPSDRREIIQCAFQKELLRQIEHGAGFSETGGLLLIDTTIELVCRKEIKISSLAPQFMELLLVSHTQKQLSDAVPALRVRYRALRRIFMFRPADAFIIKSINSCFRRDSSTSNPALFGHLYLMLNAALPPWHPLCNRRQGVTYSVQNFDNALKPYDLDNAFNGLQSTDIDVELYNSFWTAYAAMKNPTFAESPAHWRKISACMERVLRAFRSTPPTKELDDVLGENCEWEKKEEGKEKEENNKEEMENVEPEMKMEETLTEGSIGISMDSNNNTTQEKKYRHRIPKHLTSPSILRLQIEDIKVRRHVLVQYSIFLLHLELTSQHEPTGKDGASAKAGIDFCKTLFVSGGEGSILKKAVYDMLSSDDGSDFKHFVANLLQRERHWIHWKKTTGYLHCNPKPGVAPTIFKRRKVRSKSSKEKPFGWNKSQLDNAWRDRHSAWVVPPQKERVEPLLERARAELWSKDLLRMELQEDKNDEDVTDDNKRKNDSKYVWRTLRMLCEKNLTSITSLAQRDGTLDLEALIKTES